MTSSNSDPAALAAGTVPHQELEAIRALCVEAGMTEHSTTLDYSAQRELLPGTDKP